MRWLFLIALFLNLAYIAWQMLVPATDLYADIPILKNVESIVLLTELKQREKKGSVSEAVDLVQKSVKLEDEMGSVSVEDVSSDQLDIEQQAIVEDEFIAETTDRDLAEFKGQASTEESEPEPVTAESCYTLGPFRDLDKLRGFIREIKPYVVKADFRGQEENKLSVYWVYIQPEKSRKQAIKTGERLKIKKIKDFYIIREGEKNNGISLGYFKNKNGAFRLEKKVKKLGFDVLVEPMFKTYTVYWLDYQLVSGAIIPEAIIEKYSQSTEADTTSLLSSDCGA